MERKKIKKLSFCLVHTCKEETSAEKISYTCAVMPFVSGRKGVRMKCSPSRGMSISVARTAFLCGCVWLIVIVI